MNPPVNLTFLHLISTADPVVKCVIAVLVLSSFVTWAILFDKMIKLHDLNHSADSFEKKFLSNNNLVDLYETYKNKNKHPMGKIFYLAMQEWIDSHKQLDGVPHELRYLNNKNTCERIALSLENTLDKIEDSASYNLELLSMIASVSPFVGLFGTVWGIINSFRAIASAGNVGLQVVAPGIAEALITTAIGILVAVVALCLHSFLRSKIGRFVKRMEQFKCEMINLISREMDSTNPTT